MITRGLLLLGLLAAGPALAQTPPPLTYSQILTQSARQAVQERLRATGDFTGRADGNWGPDSQQALERFQQRSGLQVTGNLNPATAATLRLPPSDLLEPGSVPANGPPSPPPTAAFVAPTVPPPAAPPALSTAPAPGTAATFGPVNTSVVRGVQARLRALGLYNGLVDGVWGPLSQAAMQRFQQARELPVTTQLTPATLEALGLDPAGLDLPR